MNKGFLIIAMYTLIAAVAWIFFDFKHAQPSVAVDPKINTLLEPITPTFDQVVIDQISDIKDLPVPQPSPSVVQVLTPSPSPSETNLQPSPSPSGG